MNLVEGSVPAIEHQYRRCGPASLGIPRRLAPVDTSHSLSDLCQPGTLKCLPNSIIVLRARRFWSISAALTMDDSKRASLIRWPTTGANVEEHRAQARSKSDSIISRASVRRLWNRLVDCNILLPERCLTRFPRDGFVSASVVEGFPCTLGMEMA